MNGNLQQNDHYQLICFHKTITCDIAIMPTWYKMRHKFSYEHDTEHNRSSKNTIA